MSAAASHVYIYYRIAADTLAVRRAICQFIADVEMQTGVKGQLLARCDDASTWMEVWQPIADLASFCTALARLVDQHDLVALTIDRRRHTECFGPLPAMAASTPETAGNSAR